MKLYSIDAGHFLCDGGAVFGVVPKALWSKRYPADENNMLTASMRLLLVETEDRLILVDAGAGDRFDPKYSRNNGLQFDSDAIKGVKGAGFEPEDITDIIFTHLHWDHMCGAVINGIDDSLTLAFKNAKHWVTKDQWNNARNPNVREGASYFQKDLDTIEESGKLNLIEEEIELYRGVTLRIFNGHTNGHIVPIFDYNGTGVVYAGDFVPVAASVRIAWVAAYDLLPVVSMTEKEQFLKEIYDKNMVLFFEHDTETEMASLEWGSKGPMVNEYFSLEQFVSRN